MKTIKITPELNPADVLVLEKGSLIVDSTSIPFKESQVVEKAQEIIEAGGSEIEFSSQAQILRHSFECLN